MLDPRDRNFRTDRVLGAAFPVYAHRHRGLKVPEWAFFIAKYFGSGVIIATAFIHVSLETMTSADLIKITIQPLYKPALS